MTEFTYKRTVEAVNRLAYAIRNNERAKGLGPVSSIYGVPRGGLVPALMMARELDLPFVPEPVRGTLVVDDIMDSGATRNRFPGQPFAVLCAKGIHPQQRLDAPTYYAEVVPAQEWVRFWWEGKAEVDATDIPLRMLQFIGEDPTREGLVETPQRVVRSWDCLYGGYKIEPQTVLKVFEEDSSNEIVLLKNIEFYSTCEHHMLPFFGKAHIAYIPNGRVVGISKLARLLDVFARRLQIQERLCRQVTNTLMQHLSPLGAACILEAQHMCMTSRGVGKQNSVMVTSSLEGVFKDDPKSRQELMSLIQM